LNFYPALWHNHMKHFIDLGTYYFYGPIYKNGLLLFEEQGYFGNCLPHPWYVYTFEPSIHAFEANKQFLPGITERFASLKAVNAAISDCDGTIEFRWCPENEAGSNCTGEHITEVSENGSIVYPVQSLDIASLTAEIIEGDVEAEIHIKCDIEGSEFVVLSRLLSMEGVGSHVKAIFVEWHDRFWNGKSNHQMILQAKMEIKAQCRNMGIDLHDWQ
jgi:FkbM family methyltransferase